MTLGVRIPHHITVLYILTVANMMALFHITVTEATVIVRNLPNATIKEIDDLPASFGPQLSSEGVWGHLMYVKPTDACEKVNRSPPPVAGKKWIALVKRGRGRKSECHFDEKVLNAQEAGYIGAIIHNVDSDMLITMSGSSAGIAIPSVFIGMTGGKYLAARNASESVLVILNNDAPFDVDGALKYMIPFVVVVGISFLVTVAVAIGKWVRDYRRRRRSRLSKENLKKLPVKKFKKGDPYDVCAICLDEYEEGHKLRILPCSHAYHMKCVDPWLLNNKRVCPVCKRKVIPGDESSDSESDYDEDNANEATPLLHPGESSINGNQPHNTFDSSGLPCNVRTEVSIPDSDSDGSVEPFPQSLASQAEIHTPVLSQPSLHRNPTRTYGTLTPAHAVSPNNVHGISSELQTSLDLADSDDAGAATATANPGLDLVEEYYAETVDEAPGADNDGHELPSMLDNLQSSGSDVKVVGNNDTRGIKSRDDPDDVPI